MVSWTDVVRTAKAATGKPPATTPRRINTGTATPSSATTTTTKRSGGPQDQRIYDSLLPSDRKDALNARETIQGTEFIPVRYSGRWRTFIEKQKDTMRQQNTGRAPLFSKKNDPLLDQVHTLFFGDSYARMLEPPPPSVYVVSYPGIPIKSITRSLTKMPPEVDKRRADWIDTHTLSHQAKKKKIFLTFASRIPTRKHTYKKMFFNFDERSVAMHSYPRVDIFRQMLRFPSSALRYLVFWFGNAELQHTFYYDLFQKVMMEVPEGISVDEFRGKYYGPFVKAYVGASVAAYLRFLETVAKLEPTSVLVVILLNYSPVHSHEMRHLAPVKNLRAYGNQALIDFIFDDRTRFGLVDYFNARLTAAVRTHFSSEQLQLVDVNPLIFDRRAGAVKPEFVLNPRDVHLGDPNRRLYKFLLAAMHAQLPFETAEMPR